jgi:hypothetical protein
MGVLQDLLVRLHDFGGDGAFISACLITGIALSVWLIPFCTGLMINAAAGLTGKYIGRSYRTLVINASTNSPELFSMLVAFFFFRNIGGIANPLGANFANIYLMYLVAPLWVLARCVLAGDREAARSLGQLALREKKLVAWHVAVAVGLFILSTVTYHLLTGHTGFTPHVPARLPKAWALFLGSGICLVGAVVYLFLEYRLKRRRPELYEEIEEEDHRPSIPRFLLGTVGLIVCCYILNSMFVISSKLYQEYLAQIFGIAIVTGLHYFLGALVTSLPELFVAVENLRRQQPADLNTALSSAFWAV